MGPVTGEILFEDYNTYRQQTHSIRHLKAQRRCIRGISQKHLPKFEALLAWCQANTVDPRRWLYSLFVVRRWTYPPKLEHLCSAKHLKRYRGMGDMPAFAAKKDVERQVHAISSGSAYSPARDLSNSVESLKRVYLQAGTPRRCLDLLDSETFGYHPRSAWCQQCFLQQECLARLRGRVKYDILALRLGQITLEQARMVAHVRR